MSDNSEISIVQLPVYPNMDSTDFIHCIHWQNLLHVNHGSQYQPILRCLGRILLFWHVQSDIPTDTDINIVVLIFGHFSKRKRKKEKREVWKKAM